MKFKKSSFFKKVTAYLTILSMLMSFMPSMGVAAEEGTAAQTSEQTDLSGNLSVSPNTILSSYAADAVQIDVADRNQNKKTDYLSGSQLVFPQGNWESTVQKKLQYRSEHTESNEAKISIPNMGAIYKKIALKMSGEMKEMHYGDGFLRGGFNEYYFPSMGWDPYWSSLYNGSYVRDVEVKTTKSSITLTYMDGELMQDTLPYKEGLGEVKLNLKQDDYLRESMDIFCDITFTRRNLNNPSSLAVKISGEDVPTENYTRIVPSIEMTNGGSVSDATLLYIGSSLKFNVAEGYIPSLCYITDANDDVVFTGTYDENAFYFDDILLNNNGTYTFHLVVEKRHTLKLAIASSKDTTGNYADLHFRNEIEKLTQACTNGCITVGYKTKWAHAFDSYEKTKQIPVSDAIPDGRGLSFGDVYNLQWVNFNLPPEDTIVFDGEAYAGNETIYVDTDRLSGTDAVFCYQDAGEESYTTTPTAFTANNDTKTSFNSGTTREAVTEDTKASFMRVDDGIKLPVLPNGNTQVQIKTTDNDLASDITAKEGYVSPYALIRANEAGRDYKVVHVNGKNYILYLGVHTQTDAGVHAELRLSEVVQYQNKVVLDSPFLHDDEKYVVVDGDGTGDAEFNAYAEGGKIHVVWVSYTSENSSDTVVKYAVLDVTDAETAGFSTAVALGTGGSAYKFMPQMAGDALVYAEAIPYADDRESEKKRVFGGNTKITVALRGGASTLSSIYVSDAFTTNPYEAETILYDYAVTEMDGTYYLAYVTEQSAAVQEDTLTTYKLYLRSFTINEQEVVWGEPRLIRFVKDSKLYDQQDGEYSNGALVKHYVDGGFSSVKFLTADLGNAASNRTQGAETFLLFRMNDTVYMMKQDAVAGITQSPAYTGTIYPFFTHADAVGDVSIGADAAGNIAAVYSYCDEEDSGIYLSFYDNTVGSWGRGVRITSVEIGKTIDFSNIQVVPGRVKSVYETTKNGQEFSYTVTKPYVKYAELFEEFKAILKSYGATDEQIEERFVKGANTGVPTWLVDDVYNAAETYALIRKADFDGYPLYGTATQDELLIFTQGLASELIVTEMDTEEEIFQSSDVYVISAYQASQHIDNVEIDVDASMTRGSMVNASVSFQNAGQTAIRGSLEHPIQVSLMLNHKGVDHQIARWNISENINPGDTVRLSNDEALTYALHTDMDSSAILYIEIEESPELHEDFLTYDSRVFGVGYNPPQNPEYGIYDFEAFVSHVSKDGVPIMHAEFDVMRPLADGDFAIAYYQASEAGTWERKDLSGAKTYVSGAAYVPDSSEAAQGMVSICLDNRILTPNDYYLSETAYKKMLLQYYSDTPVTSYTKETYRGQDYWYDSNKYSSIKEAYNAASAAELAWSYDWENSVYYKNSYGSLDEAKAAYLADLKRLYIITAEAYAALSPQEAANWHKTADSGEEYVYIDYDSYEKANTAYLEAVNFSAVTGNIVVSEHVDLYIPVQDLSASFKTRFDILYDEEMTKSVCKTVNINPIIFASEPIVIGTESEAYIPVEVLLADDADICALEICAEGEALLKTVTFVPYGEAKDGIIKGSVGIVAGNTTGSGTIKVYDSKTGANKVISFEVTDENVGVINVNQDSRISFSHEGWRFEADETAYQGDRAKAQKGATFSFYTTAKTLKLDLVGTVLLQSDLLQSSVELTGTEEDPFVSVQFNNAFGKLHKVTVVVESMEASLDALWQENAPLLCFDVFAVHKGNSYALYQEDGTPIDRFFVLGGSAYVTFGIGARDPEDDTGIIGTELYRYDEAAEEFVVVGDGTGRKITQNGTYRAKLVLENEMVLEKQFDVNCFTSQRALENAEITLAFDACVYNGSPQTPDVSVIYDGKPADETQYTVEYRDHIHAGTATVVVAAVEDGIYTGIVTKEFVILPKSLSDATVTVENDGSFSYTGEEIKAKVTVTVEGKTLTEDDYTLSYENNIMFGEASVTVTGVKNYKDAVCVPFTIAKELPAEKNEAGYYEIKNMANLFWFAQLVNAGTQDTNAVLVADINLGDIEWIPIGSSANPYSGHFDGQGYTVSGLKITQSFGEAGTAVEDCSGGLFGNIKSAGIRNLIVSGIIDYTIARQTDNAGTALLVGMMTDSMVYNCHVSGSIANGGFYVGGLVGIGQHSIIINCSSSADITSNAMYMGGLVGFLSAGYDAPLCLLNSYCTGSVSHGATDSGTYYVGGLVGELRDDAVNNYFSGSVTCTGTSTAMGTLFGNVGNSIDTDPSDTSATTTFTPVIAYNYHADGTPIGKVGELDTTGYTQVYADHASLRNHLNSHLTEVEEIIAGHRGYLATSQWAELIALLDGENVKAFHWHTAGNSTPHLKDACCDYNVDCICDGCGKTLHIFNDNGICSVCDGYQPAELLDDYYQIQNAGNLFWFANYINTVDRTANALLLKDIDLENRPWTPIGFTNETSNNFRGIFDGQNHTIRGLYVEGGRAGLGFFGEVRTGTVKNFTIYGEVVANTEVNYVGGVIGSICGLNGENDLERNGAIIQNITSFVNVTAKAHGIGMIGGFVGYANHESLIENCSWYGTFDAGIYRVDSGAGGFIGKIQENSSAVTIRNCAAYGTIKTNYEKNSYNNTPTIFIGGFLSFSNTNAQTQIENCLFAGKYEKGEKLSDEARLGAFGTLQSVNAIRNCYYLGDDGLGAVFSDSPLKPNGENIQITSVTGAQLASGEIAYLLQCANEIWGQDLSMENSLPVLGGDKVYESNGIYHNEVTAFEVVSIKDSGTKATATVAVPKAGSYMLVFADYEQTRLNRIDFVTVTAERDNMMIPVTSENDITIGKDDKLMLWSDMAKLAPLCKPYVVKQ